MKKLLLILLVLFQTTVCLTAEELNMPESITWDSANQRYLVANTGNGRILSMNSNNEISLFAQGFSSPKGIVIVDNVCYFTDNKDLYGLNINTADLVLHIEITEAFSLNDICSDGAGNLYIGDMNGNSIYKYDITNDLIEKLSLSAEIISPNGLCYDNGMLYVVSYSENAPIYSIDLSTNTVVTVKTTSFAYLDGIAKDENNNFYISCWGISTGSVYKYNSDFTNNPTLIKSDLNGPADFIYRADIQTIILPLMNENKIDFVLIGIPQKVVLSSPANDIILNEYRVKLMWQAVAGVSKYKIQISKNEDFSTTISNNEYVTNYTEIITLDTTTKYYWRVSAFNLGQWGQWSDTWNFTTGKMVYIAPTPLSPAHQAAGVSTNPTLIWTKSPGGIYEVQIAFDANFNNIKWSAEDLTDTMIVVTPSLNVNSTYYWRVRTYSGIITSDWSLVSMFSTYNTAPAAPELLFPGNFMPAIMPVVTLEWKKVSNALDYKIELSPNDAFPIENTHYYTVSATNDNIQKYKLPDTLKYTTQYWWRIKSANDFGEGAWSEMFAFQTVNKEEDTTKSVNDIHNYITIGPNPAEDYLDIKVSMTMDNPEFEIVNINGEIVSSYSTIATNKEFTYRINVKNLTSGMYLLRIIDNKQTDATIKFIKK